MGIVGCCSVALLQSGIDVATILCSIDTGMVGCCGVALLQSGIDVAIILCSINFIQVIVGRCGVALLQSGLCCSHNMQH